MPPSKISLSSNPIRVIRERESKTLMEFSKDCSVGYQLLYLNESGCYPHILPSIMYHLEVLGGNPQELEFQYKQFVKDKRLEFKERYFPWSLPIPTGDLNPISEWRLSLNLTRTALSKNLCVQPSVLERLETKKVNIIPEQFIEALHDIDFPERLIEELRDRVADYHCR